MKRKRDAQIERDNIYIIKIETKLATIVLKDQNIQRVSKNYNCMDR